MKKKLTMANKFKDNFIANKKIGGNILTITRGWVVICTYLVNDFYYFEGLKLIGRLESRMLINWLRPIRNP